MQPTNADNFVTNAPRGRPNKAVYVIAAGVALLLVLVAVAAASVLSASPRQTVEPSTTAPTPSPTPSPTEESGLVLASNQATIAIVIVPTIKIYESASETAPVKAELDMKNEHGVDQVFLVKEMRGSWANALLPIRPNGSKGWIQVKDVKITSTTYRVKVHVADKRLELYDGDSLYAQYPVGIGKQNTPTPGGEYYIKELLKPTKENGPYGTYAYGLSGFSNVLDQFNGGPGVIGIHGTNDPSTIGKEVSAGCIRLKNEDIEKLVKLLPLGTPVEIVAQ